MAQLTIMDMQVQQRMFGQRGTKYAIFRVHDPVSNAVIQAGVTHKSLEDKGFDLNFLDSMQGCTLKTFPYTDRTTGEVIDPDVYVNKAINGESTIVLLNSLGHVVEKSAMYVADKKDNANEVQAKLLRETKKEQDLAEMRQAATRAQAKLIALTTGTQATPPATPAATPVVKTEEPAPVATFDLNEELPFS